MAGNRLEKLGTIFKRINGLIRAGALAPAERPLWFEIYKRYPPKEEPLYDRPIPEKTVRPILYKEDLVRSRFYNEFGSPGVVDMMDQSAASIAQKFVDTYNEMIKNVDSDDKAFEQTITALRAQGILLETLDEKAKRSAELFTKKLNDQRQGGMEQMRSKEKVRVSVHDLFNKAKSDEDDMDEIADELHEKR